MARHMSDHKWREQKLVAALDTAFEMLKECAKTASYDQAETIAEVCLEISQAIHADRKPTENANEQ
jgi:hypothetical protein